MGTSAPIRRTTEEPNRVGNPYFAPQRVAPSKERPPEVAPPQRSMPGKVAA